MDFIRGVTAIPWTLPQSIDQERLGSVCHLPHALCMIKVLQLSRDCAILMHRIKLRGRPSY